MNRGSEIVKDKREEERGKKKRQYVDMECTLTELERPVERNPNVTVDLVTDDQVGSDVWMRRYFSPSFFHNTPCWKGVEILTCTDSFHKSMRTAETLWRNAVESSDSLEGADYERKREEWAINVSCRRWRRSQL